MDAIQRALHEDWRARESDPMLSGSVLPDGLRQMVREALASGRPFHVTLGDQEYTDLLSALREVERIGIRARAIVARGETLYQEWRRAHPAASEAERRAAREQFREPGRVADGAHRAAHMAVVTAAEVG